MSWWNPASWDWGTVGKTIAVTPLAVPYALGATLNQLTGGHTETWSVWSAINGAGGKNRFSNVTQATSGYDDPSGVPGEGRWGLPFLNPATPRVAADAVNATLKGFGLPNLTTILLLGGAAAFFILKPKE